MANLSNFQKRQQWATPEQILAAMQQGAREEEDYYNFYHNEDDACSERAIELRNDEWASRENCPEWAQ